MTATVPLLTVEEYHRLAAVGLFPPDARTELVEGKIVYTPPISAEHGGATDRALYRLVRLVGDEVIVRVQNPLRLDAQNEPQPDLMLLRYRDDFYRTAHPTAADALLIIEVSVTTLAYDTGEKLALYATHGIPEYWVADLPGAALRQYWQPEGAGYTQLRTWRRGETIQAATIPDLALRVDDILGMAPGGER
jgi:Uma2 family endonuclease